VAVLGATANGPDTGRAIGLNVALLANSEPRKPTLACAKADWALSGSARLATGGTLRASGAAGCLAARIPGRGFGMGTFLGAAKLPAMAEWAQNAPTATSARAKLNDLPWRFRLIASIQSLARSLAREAADSMAP
jgi:hypothetical protein